MHHRSSKIHFLAIFRLSIKMLSFAAEANQTKVTCKVFETNFSQREREHKGKSCKTTTNNKARKSSALSPAKSDFCEA